MKKYLWFFLFSSVLFFWSIASYAGAANKPDFNIVVQDMEKMGDQFIMKYQPTDGLTTMDGFSDLYFNHYEGRGMETAVLTISNGANSKTEALFTQLIGKSSQGAPVSELQQTWMALKTQFAADLTLLNNTHMESFSGAFLQSFIILLREGFEALLIVTALLTYLRRSPHANKTHVIHYGVIAALIASGVTTLLFATFFKSAGQNREAMEGIVMLIASAVLFYVSYWLFAKREAEKWQKFIKSTMDQALSSGSMFALILAAFLAVYREGAETILFYQALWMGNPHQTFALVSGFAAACISLLVVYQLMQRASFRLPFRLFFTLTALFLYYMAFYFIGGGILELQMAGWVSVSPIDGMKAISWLGIFPAWQNISAQLIFLVPTLAALAFSYLKSKQLYAERAR